MDCLTNGDLPGRGHRVLGIHFLIMITRAGWGDPATDVLAQFHTVRACVALALRTESGRITKKLSRKACLGARRQAALPLTAN